MNKLISRNPVQRFKQGRKIVKAQFSWGEGFGSSWNNPYLIQGEAQRKADEDIVKYWEKQGDGTYDEAQRTADEAIVQELAKSEVKPKQTTTKKTRTARQLNAPKFYGQTIGGKVLARGSNFNGLINDSQRQALLNAGFKNEDFNNVRSFQIALNNFFSKDGAGSITVDDKWGDQTQKAFNMALSRAGYDPSNKMGLTPTTLSNIYNQNKLEGLYAAGLLKKPESLTVPENKLPTINTKIRGGNFNKSQIRDLIRKGGFNPYAYTGAQRKALRLYLNGLSDDTSLLDGTDLARFTLPFRKKGGILPSRNIVKRFKNRKFN